ncbi:MAG: hypothetical protein O2800_07590, partial [Planctomycetota bacterium]|nr:hypothetical protein [Planctomycetota bacterium]
MFARTPSSICMVVSALTLGTSGVTFAQNACLDAGVDAACCDTVCSFNPLCCDVLWDQECIDLQSQLCGGGGGGCGSGGDCCVANPGTTGCLDSTCCETVCAADPYCCATEWDQLCANQAAVSCPACTVSCTLPANTSTEVEPCGSDTNGGCNANGETEPIALGDSVRGNFWASGGTRDTDWYTLTVAEGTEISLSISSAAGCFAALVDTSCGGVLGGSATVGACPGTSLKCVPAGTYLVVALPSFFDGMACGTGVVNDYVLQVGGTPCLALPPSNDTCATADVAIEGANPFDNSFATTDMAGATCGFGGAPFLNDVFFTFTATQTGDYHFETCTGSAPFDTGIEIWSACPDAGGTMLACNDDGAGCPVYASSLFVSLTMDQVVSIRVGGWNGATGATEMNIVFVGDAPSCGDVGMGDCCIAGTTPFCSDLACCQGVCAFDPYCCDVTWDEICANEAAGFCVVCGGSGPPVNDLCADAVSIGLGDHPLNTAGAGTDGANPTDPMCGTFAAGFFNDVWFTFVAPSTANFNASTCNLVDFDSRIDILDGCAGNIVACNDDGTGCAGFSSFVSWAGTEGTTYVIRVGGYDAGSFGNGTLSITDGAGGPSGPANDLCADAVSIGLGDHPLNTAGAGTDGAN